MSVALWKTIFDWAAVVLVGFTFIAGAGALITGRILNTRQDLQLREFKTKEQTELAEQKRLTATAEQHAAEANERAAKAEAGTSLAKEEAAKSNKIAAEATETAEQERIARLKLEQDISPRILEQANSSKALRSFRGIQVAIVPVEGADLETRRTAGQIALMCQMSNWTMDENLARLSNAVFSGEGLEVEFNTNPAISRSVSPDDSTFEAAGVLLDIFRTNKMPAMMWPRGLSTTMPALPEGVIIIHVGLKPLGNYFLQERTNSGPKDEHGNSVLGNEVSPIDHCINNGTC
jgi:hypothetical protein